MTNKGCNPPISGMINTEEKIKCLEAEIKKLKKEKEEQANEIEKLLEWKEDVDQKIDDLLFTVFNGSYGI